MDLHKPPKCKMGVMIILCNNLSKSLLKRVFTFEGLAFLLSVQNMHSVLVQKSEQIFIID